MYIFEQLPNKSLVTDYNRRRKRSRANPVQVNWGPQSLSLSLKDFPSSKFMKK